MSRGLFIEHQTFGFTVDVGIDNIVLIKEQVGEDRVPDFQGSQRRLLTAFEVDPQSGVVSFPTEPFAFDLQVHPFPISFHIKEPIEIIKQELIGLWCLVRLTESQFLAIGIKNNGFVDIRQKKLEVDREELAAGRVLNFA